MARTLQLLEAGHDREDVEVRRLGSIHRLGKHARMAIKIRSFRKIEFTDFPLDTVSLWFQNNTIFLPSEY